MKLVSPKTLLASLLGCTFVVMKVMTFDGLVEGCVRAWGGVGGAWIMSVYALSVWHLSMPEN